LAADFAEFVSDPALARVLGALDAYDAALADRTAGGDHASAQGAWTELMLAWQEVELMQIGPARSSLSGGEDIRDEIYSWPTGVNACRIDQETLEEDWDSATFFEDNLVNSYGLDGLEQLTFGGEETICPSQVGIDEAWAELGPEGVEANRVAFAAVLSADVRGHVESLVGTVPGDEDEVFAALFYLDSVTKDLKLGGELEHEPSGIAAQAVQANLEGFRAGFTGGEGYGFDDWLAEVGHADLADQILAETDEAIATAAATASLEDGTEQLFAEVKDVTDLLKGDMVTVLTLTIPDEASGDND